MTIERTIDWLKINVRHQDLSGDLSKLYILMILLIVIIYIMEFSLRKDYYYHCLDINFSSNRYYHTKSTFLGIYTYISNLTFKYICMSNSMFSVKIDATEKKNLRERFFKIAFGEIYIVSCRGD